MAKKTNTKSRSKFKGEPDFKSKGGKFNGKSDRNRRSNGRGANSLPEESGDKFEKQRNSDRTNSVNWYAPTERILADTATIPFNHAIGNVFDDSISNVRLVNAIPGIMEVKYIPTVGVSTDYSSPINIAAKNIYSTIRHEISGTRKYDASDVMTYLIPITSIFNYWAWCCRLYGIHKYFVLRNRYVPEGIFRAMHVDYDDFVNHLADFRAKLNQIAFRLSNYKLPKDIPLIDRQMLLNEAIFADGMSDLDQIYFYNTIGHYKYQPAMTDTGGACQLIPSITELFTYNKPAKVSDLIEYFDKLFFDINTDNDFDKIGADIETAYSENALMHIAELTEDYNIAPIYSLEMNEQLNNADILPIKPFPKDITTKGFNRKTATDFDIIQDVNRNILYHDPNAWLKNINTEEEIFDVPTLRILNTKVSDPNPSIVMAATRLKVAIDEKGRILGCGSEIVTGITVHNMSQDLDTNGKWYTVPQEWSIKSNIVYTINGEFKVLYSTDENSGEIGNLMGLKYLLEYFSKWEYAPMIYTYDVTPLLENEETIAQFKSKHKEARGRFTTLQNLANFTPISNFKLSDLHSVAIMGEFNIPGTITYKGTK
nr:MAG: capsid protein [Human picobirnavirus]